MMSCFNEVTPNVIYSRPPLRTHVANEVVRFLIIERLSCHDEYEYECDGKTMKYFDIMSLQELCYNFLVKQSLKNCFLTYILRFQIFA